VEIKPLYYSAAFIERELSEINVSIGGNSKVIICRCFEPSLETNSIRRVDEPIGPMMALELP
jgi:hypothetical protein